VLVPQGEPDPEPVTASGADDDEGVD
jgi:hypothetical protein